MIKFVSSNFHNPCTVEEFKEQYMLMDDRDIYNFILDNKNSLTEDFLREYIDVIKDQVMYVTNVSIDFKREFWNLTKVPNWIVEDWDEKTFSEFKDGNINWNFAVMYNKKISIEFKKKFREKATLIENSVFDKK